MLVLEQGAVNANLQTYPTSNVEGSPWTTRTPLYASALLGCLPEVLLELPNLGVSPDFWNCNLGIPTISNISGLQSRTVDGSILKF